MLTIQPKMADITAFEARKRRSENISPEEKERREYEKARRELMEQKEDLIDLSEDKDITIPPIAQKAIKGGVVVSSGILGGMATGFGTKTTIRGFKKLGNTQFVKSIKKQIKNTNKFIKDSLKTIKKNFLKSDAYQVPANAIKKRYVKFADTKFGKPIVSFFKAIGNGIKAVFKGIKNAFRYIKGKITGVKGETYEKATVNFVGASGGVASGVTALKEQQEKDNN